MWDGGLNKQKQMKTKLEKQKENAINFLTKNGVSNLIPEAMEKMEKEHKRKQKRNHIIFWVIVFSVVAGIMNKVTAQTSDNLILLTGYRSIEVGYSYNNEEFLNFGYSFALVDANQVEKRAIKNDIYLKAHDLNTNYIPAVFGLVGGTFDELTMTGKMGFAYVDQNINGVTDKRKLYLAVGIMISREISEHFSVAGSYDNVSAVQGGLIYKF